jgi:hypothetical protein
MDKLTTAIDEIKHELEKATTQHPYWPDDIIHQVSIMNEEAGESIRAALNCVYHGDSFDDILKELVQTGAMVLRCLINLQETKQGELF